MIFGHAPVIFPSVLEISIPYRAVFYVHVGLLHSSLQLRVVGDLATVEPLRVWGAWINAVAILLFLGATGFSVVHHTAEPDSENTRREPPDVGPTSADQSSDVSPGNLPDLELP